MTTNKPEVAGFISEVGIKSFGKTNMPATGRCMRGLFGIRQRH